MMKSIDRVLIVEDSPQTAYWMEDCVKTAAPEASISIARSCAEARNVLMAANGLRRETMPPNLVLVDLGLPDGSGIDLIVLVKERFPNCLAAVVTIFDDDDNLFHSIAAGADGYLLKHAEHHRFVDYLKRLGDGEPQLSPSIARRILAHLSDRASDSSRNANEVLLTSREKDVLALLGRGFKLRQVALKLDVSQNTVSSHVKAIYRKLNIRSRAEAALHAQRLGLLDSDENANSLL